MYRNKHTNNKSSFVIRHGNNNRIIENVFEGSGGIRVYGSDNMIIGNHFRNNSSSSSFPPLTVRNGDVEEDPNVNHPNGGESHACYAQVKNNIIENNTFENCNTTCVVWGGKDNKFKPVNNKFRNNKVVADDEAQLRLIEFSCGATPKGNEFANIEVFGKVDHSDLPQNTVIKLQARPQVTRIDIPSIPISTTQQS